MKGEFEDCAIAGRNPDDSVAYYSCPSDLIGPAGPVDLGMCDGSYEDNYQATMTIDGSNHLARAALREKNYKNAACWAVMGEKEGDPRALTTLGLVYSKPQYEGFSNERAFQYFKQAADRGDVNGEYLLSLAYRDGVGTQPSANDADLWMAKAMATDEGKAIAARYQQQEAASVTNQQGASAILQLILGILSADDGVHVSQAECDRLFASAGNAVAMGQAHDYGCKHSCEH